MKTMRTKIAAAALTGAVAFGAGVIFSQPADAQPSEIQTDRTQQRDERLQSLIDDGVITQERADEIRDNVAERQAKREDRQAERSAHLDELAAALGTTADELKADLQAGASLAELAEAAGVDVETLIVQIGNRITTRVDEAIANGTIDQERAEERLADLQDRITARVNGERPERAERPAGFRPHGRVLERAGG